MVVANRTVDIAELKARNPLGDTVEAAGVALQGKGRVRQGVCPSTRKRKAASRCTPTRRGSTASAAAPEAMCWTSCSGRRG